MWIVFGVCAAALAGYVVLLVTIARTARPRPLNVVNLGLAMSPQFATRRVVNS